jgi:hypothetical protein
MMIHANNPTASGHSLSALLLAFPGILEQHTARFDEVVEINSECGLGFGCDSLTYKYPVYIDMKEEVASTRRNKH